MIDITGLREDKRPQSSIVVHALLDRLEAAESECLEQARLNGMGSEREAALMAKLEAAEKDIAVKEEVIDSLAAVVKRLDAQCDAAERERDECNRRRLEAADHFAAQTALMKQKYDELRAKITEMEQQAKAYWSKITEMEQQKPVGTAVDMPGTIGFTKAYFIADKVPLGSRLYAGPGAKGEEK